MRVLVIVALVALAVFLVGWLGLRVRPAPFPALAAPAGRVDSVPLPAGLPAPVERYYRQEFGARLPLVRTAVVSGRGSMRLFGLRVPIRFRFAHEAGRDYRHDIDLTIFGLPVMRARETFIDGRGWARTPGGVEQGAGFDQGSNVSLWAEALIWFPSVLVTDARVQWRPVDDATALLVVPFGAGSETLVVRFDPASGEPQHIEAMKYNSALKKQMLWISGVWAHEGSPWLRMDVDEISLNGDVRDYIREPLGEPSGAKAPAPG